MPATGIRVLRNEQRAGFPAALLNSLVFLAISTAMSAAVHAQEVAPAVAAATPTVEEVVVTG